MNIKTFLYCALCAFLLSTGLAQVDGFQVTGNRVPVSLRLPAASSLPQNVVVTKLRSDRGAFFFFTGLSPDGIAWHQWTVTNRSNNGVSGAHRVTPCTLANLYASSSQAKPSNNINTGTQRQTVSQNIGTASGTFTGTWTSAATVSGVSDIRYSTVTGDKAEFTVTVAQGGMILIRSVGVTNGGFLDVKIFNSSTMIEIPSANYSIRPSSDGTENTFKLTNNGFIVNPIAENLPAATYLVRFTRSAFSAAAPNGRAYIGGIQVIDAPVKQPGLLGIWAEVNITGILVNRSVQPTSRVAYAFSGPGRLRWTYATSTNLGIAQYKIYDTATGNEVSSSYYSIPSQTIDQYAVSNAVNTVTVADGLPSGNYLFEVVTTKPRNAASTDNQVTDGGITVVNTTVAGNPSTDAFDTLGMISDISDNGYKFIGVGNLEQAIQVRDASASSGENFVGGTHAYESAPTNEKLYIDGVDTNWQAASLFTKWVASQEARTEFDTQLLLPDGSGTPWANVHFKYTFNAKGYTPEITVNVIRSVTVFEDYGMMLNVPNRAGIQGGVAGGFNQVWTDTLSGTYSSVGDNSYSLGTTTHCIFYNDTYLVDAQMGNWPEVRDTSYSWESPLTVSQSNIQTRPDGIIKYYLRINRPDANGVTVYPGFTYRTIKTYRCAKR